MRALQRLLHLTPQQHRAIARIFEREEPGRHKAIGEMMNACGDSVRRHKARVDAEIRAALRPDQQEKFDQLARRQNERFALAPFAPPARAGYDSSDAGR
jgi:DNA-binding MarR family transcriptional regulator